MDVKSNSSIITSGYGSYMRSQYLENVCPINLPYLDHLDHNFLPIDKIYSFIPRKNNTGRMRSELNIVSKSSQHGCSILVQDFLNKEECSDEEENIYEANDDDSVIFV